MLAAGSTVCGSDCSAGSSGAGASVHSDSAAPGWSASGAASAPSAVASDVSCVATSAAGGSSSEAGAPGWCSSWLTSDCGALGGGATGIPSLRCSSSPRGSSPRPDSGITGARARSRPSSSPGDPAPSRAAGNTSSVVSVASSTMAEACTAPTISGSCSSVSWSMGSMSTRTKRDSMLASRQLTTPSPWLTISPLLRSTNCNFPRTSECMPAASQKNAPKLGIPSAPKVANCDSRCSMELDSTTWSQMLLTRADLLAGAGCRMTSELGPARTTQEPGV